METKKDKDWYVSHLSYSGDSLEQTRERLRIRREKMGNSLKRKKHGK